jgi:hypothetical protein
MLIRVVLDHGLLDGSLQLSLAAVDRRQRKRLSSSIDVVRMIGPCAAA